MAVPNFNPVSATSRIVLPSVGIASDVTASLAFGIYKDNSDFVQGAVEQISFVYQRLGGPVLDIELTPSQVYNAYEEAVLEYSTIVNTHQAKNALPSALGASTASFDDHGEISGSAANGSQLILPRFTFGYAKRIMDLASEEIGVGGNTTVYSASFDVMQGQQDYNLQSIVEAHSLESGCEFSGSVGNKKILIRKVFYRTPRAMWRFFGYYGGLNVVGNLHTYGQYADDSTFEVVPAWQNKLQAMDYADSLYTRISHYSYDLRNNKLRLYPVPADHLVSKMWFEFVIPQDSFSLEDSGHDTGMNGVNNLNTLPFANIPYENINSIGKQWIRRYALAIAKEMLGHTRGKYSGNVPIPGSNITLNSAELISSAKDEQGSLREELIGTLDDLTYPKLMETSNKMAQDAKEIAQISPMLIYKG